MFIVRLSSYRKKEKMVAIKIYAAIEAQSETMIVIIMVDNGD